MYIISNKDPWKGRLSSSPTQTKMGMLLILPSFLPHRDWPFCVGLYGIIYLKLIWLVASISARAFLRWCVEMLIMTRPAKWYKMEQRQQPKKTAVRSTTMTISGKKTTGTSNSEDSFLWRTPTPLASHSRQCIQESKSTGADLTREEP